MLFSDAHFHANQAISLFLDKIFDVLYVLIASKELLQVFNNIEIFSYQYFDNGQVLV